MNLWLAMWAPQGSRPFILDMLWNKQHICTAKYLSGSLSRAQGKTVKNRRGPAAVSEDESRIKPLFTIGRTGRRG